jgi:hypothetical protein
MAVADMIPQLSDAELASLKSNAVRQEASAEGARKAAAAELLPLIEAEIAARLETRPKPAPKVRAARAKPAKAQA